MSLKKGVSLPINILIILAVSLVVFLGIVSLFTGTFPSGGQQMNDQQKRSNCCQKYINKGKCGDGKGSTWSSNNCNITIEDLDRVCCMGINTSM